jgi:hypothetical protein
MNRSRIRYCIMGILAVFMFIQGTRAQYIEVKTEFDTNQIRIGEVFHMDVQVNHPEGIRVDFPLIQDTLIDKIEVLSAFPADTILNSGMLEIFKKYRLTSFDTGLYVVPPLKFQFHSDVWTDSIESNRMFLYVHTVQTDSSIYDVKVPIHMPVGFIELLPFLLGGVFLLAAIGFLIWYLRRRKKNKPLFRSVKPEDPAHIIAFRELRELKDEKLWQQSEFKSYYTRLTEIVRRYMERRYNMQAMEMTSYDILESWRLSRDHREDLTGKLRSLLDLADLVKFAKQKPVASENEENMERAYEFVDETKWVAPESTEE